MDRGIIAVGFIVGVGTIILIVYSMLERYFDKQIDKLLKSRGQK